MNLVGYLQHQLSLGDSGRRMAEILEISALETSRISFGASASPMLDPPFPADESIDHSTTIAVIAPDQLPVLAEQRPDIIAASDRLIAYCFWELSELSEPSRLGTEFADEIWVSTTFNRDIFERSVNVPVRLVPLPIAAPSPSDRDRVSFPPLADAGDRCVFGITFDHFSVAERKNPFGAIDAFRTAFPPGGGPLLVVKTFNADKVPDAHERLVAHAAGHPDIVVWDECLSTADQHAFIAALDVLVSLHRGEGLGVHLAEAMWLGVPVIATGYSGNTDFMDDSCARLVDYSFIPVSSGGGIYQDGAVWADANVDHAAAIMTELANDAELRRQLGQAAVQRMRSRPTAADTATLIESLLA